MRASRVLRARAFAGLRWPDKTVEEYTAALKESPNDQQLLLELHRSRAFFHVSQRRWQEAAAEYARASDFDLNEPYYWWYQALLHLAMGDKEKYRSVCATMLQRFRATEDPRTAHSVVSACTLLPDTLPDMRPLVPVGEVAARWYPGSIRMLAAAQCRAGATKRPSAIFKTPPCIIVSAPTTGCYWPWLTITLVTLSRRGIAKAEPYSGYTRPIVGN